MGIFRQALGGIAGGRVLDVATGRGDFIGVLKRRLKSYTEIVGIDNYEKAIEAAWNCFDGGNTQITQMDAEYLGFKGQCFDTVSVSKSLHHLANLPQVLREIRRVLRPGGHLVVCDMVRDAQTEAQRTDVYIHHWAADVDTLLGFSHNRTFARQELVNLVEGLGLANIMTYDRINTDSDPMDAEAIRGKEEIIDRYLQRAQELPNYGVLKRRGEDLRRRLREVGIQSEPVLVVVGERRST